MITLTEQGAFIEQDDLSGHYTHGVLAAMNLVITEVDGELVVLPEPSE